MNFVAKFFPSTEKLPDGENFYTENSLSVLKEYRVCIGATRIRIRIFLLRKMVFPMNNNKD